MVFVRTRLDPFHRRFPFSTFQDAACSHFWHHVFSSSRRTWVSPLFLSSSRTGFPFLAPKSAAPSSFQCHSRHWRFPPTIFQCMRMKSGWRIRLNSRHAVLALRWSRWLENGGFGLFAQRFPFQKCPNHVVWYIASFQAPRRNHFPALASALRRKAVSARQRIDSQKLTLESSP